MCYISEEEQVIKQPSAVIFCLKETDEENER